ncbi:MAG: ABC transporter permease, partial [Phycisphaerales bacterium]|nr:ABC transporter permease [Phycisphaerales bacterium]
SQIATRNWQTRPGRTGLAVLSVTLGVAVVVWVTCCYESVRRGVTDVVLQWIGRSHVIIEPSAGVWGLIPDDVTDLVRDIPGVEHVTTRTREYVEVAPGPQTSTPIPDNKWADIEVTGVDPGMEPQFRSYHMREGRFLEPDDKNAIVIERLLADEFRLGVGDTILMRDNDAPKLVEPFTIVGVIDRRRASLNQAMMTWTRLDAVQRIVKIPGKIKGIDIIASDPTIGNIQRIAAEARRRIDDRAEALQAKGETPDAIEINTTEAQHKKLDAAKGLLQFIMLLLSCVVLLTAFFIILATMSMGVSERIAELGLLRCVGVTRAQLTGFILIQTLPLGIVGTMLGVPIGLAFQWLTLRAAPDYLGVFAVSDWGMLLAIFGGLGTTLLGAAVPAISAFEVSPIEASRASSRTSRRRWIWIVGAVGAMALVAHELVNRSLPAHGEGAFDAQSIASVILLYFGAALLVPPVIAVAGRIAIHIAAIMLRLRPQLLGDEIVRAPFRAGAISAALMVGLSMIVGLVVWGESVKQGWRFPSEFPDALLYTYKAVPLKKAQALENTPGVKPGEFTVTDDFAFSLRKPRDNVFMNLFSGADSLSRCLAIDTETGFRIVKLTFLEGNEEDARRRLNEGGHILVTREFAKAQKKHLDDKVGIWVAIAPSKAAEVRKALGDKARVIRSGDYYYRRETFRIAGVIASPGLDIAISFFNAGTYFQSYAVGAIICTLDDADRLFGRRSGKLMLFNFDLPEHVAARVQSDSSQTIRPQKMTETEAGRQTFALGGGPIPGDGPEEKVINTMLEKLNWPVKAFVTARELKQKIDDNINRVTLLLSVIPFAGLLIAALGLGNLMAANVASRAKHLAVLRAIGVTRGQVLRMIVGEALVLALIGGGLGLGLGFVLGQTSNRMTALLSGFEPSFSIPWALVGYGALAATALCILAAVLPAMRASRANVVAALSDL